LKLIALSEQATRTFSLFFNGFYRIDPATGQWLDGVQYASTGELGGMWPAWGVDLAVLPDNGVLMLGRQNGRFPWNGDAWQTGDPQLNPVGFLRVYSAEFDPRFSTALPGVLPFAIVPLSEKRFLIVGQSNGVVHRAVPQQDKTFEVTAEPNPGLALTKNALFDKPAGGSDGYWMIVGWTDVAGKPGKTE
jgi:hypothetical protein